MAQTPWIDAAEWCHVRELLHAPSAAARARGVRWVNGLWASRGRVPVSAAATAELTELLEACNSRATCLALAMALVRAVNGLADAAQRGGRARDIRVVLDGLHLDLVVDVRHAATHGPLSSTQVLQRSARQVLALLHRYYWHWNDPPAAEEEHADSQSKQKPDANLPSPTVVLQMVAAQRWDGRAETLLDEWASWEPHEIQQAVRAVAPSGWKPSALQRARKVWGVRVWRLVAARASVGALEWLVEHGRAHRRLLEVVWRRAVLRNLTLAPATWARLHDGLGIDPRTTQWLCRHRPPVNQLLRTTALQDDDDADADAAAVARTPLVAPPVRPLPRWSGRAIAPPGRPLVPTEGPDAPLNVPPARWLRWMHEHVPATVEIE